MIIKEIKEEDGKVEILLDLPQGYTAEELLRMFKSEVREQLDWRDLKGKDIYLNGRMLVQMMGFITFYARNRKAHNIYAYNPQLNKYLIVVGYDDPDYPLEFEYDIGMVVKAKVFGNSVQCKIISKSSNNRVQVQTLNRRQTAWIPYEDIEEFIRWGD